MSAPLPDTNALADAFAAVLAEWLTPGEFAEMRRRNATSPYGDLCCASHDFCDANMAMWEAWEKTAGVPPSFTDEAAPERIEAEMAVWNAAWKIAKAAKLTDGVSA